MSEKQKDQDVRGDSPDRLNEELAREIAGIIQETGEDPLRQIRQIIAYCGAAFAREILQATLKTEAEGGIQTLDGKRRRSIGGVFFYLAKGRMNPDARQRIFPNFGQSRKGSVLEWQDRVEVVSSLKEESGSLRHAQITLKGRPGKIYQRDNSIVTTITHEHASAPYPKGVPHPPPEGTLYTVYIGKQQWERVEPFLDLYRKSPLVIEGTCAYDGQTGSIAVFATSVKTRESERQQRGRPKSSKSAKTKSRKFSQSAKNKANPATNGWRRIADIEDVEARMTEEDAERWRQLCLAADTLRKRVETMEKSEMKMGLMMTRKLLEDKERQLEALARKYANTPRKL